MSCPTFCLSRLARETAGLGWQELELDDEGPLADGGASSGRGEGGDEWEEGSSASLPRGASASALASPTHLFTFQPIIAYICSGLPHLLQLLQCWAGHDC